MKSLFGALRSTANLEKAARHVCERAMKSRSAEVKREAEDFMKARTLRIQRLQRSLREQSFQFAPATAIMIPRPNKLPRPIILAPIENRIVQRAILQVLQGDSAAKLAGVPAVREVLATRTSVGGIAGIDTAIGMVREAIRNGAKWYARADMKNFFGSVPREPVVAFIEAATSDEYLTRLFRSALDTVLDNAERLSADELALLPDDETGVAQGSALSMLVGNILLRDFDRRLQGRGVMCIRYVDDFIVLGERRDQVVKAFEVATSILEALGITVYQPDDGSDKAELARVDDGIAFLGCQLHGGLIAPARKAQQGLLAAVREIIAKGRQDIQAAARGSPAGLKGKREAQTVSQVDLVKRGWGHAFAFCNARKAFARLDTEIDRQLVEFRRRNAALAAALPANERARVHGVTRLVDIPLKALPVRSGVSQ
jgi:RNA-directed DNA polymerase